MEYPIIDDSVVVNSVYYIIHKPSVYKATINQIHNDRSSYYRRHLNEDFCLITYYTNNNDMIITYRNNNSNKINLKNKLDDNILEFPNLMFYRKMSNNCIKTGNFFGLELMDKHFNTLFVIQTENNNLYPERITCFDHNSKSRIVNCSKLIKLEDNFSHIEKSWSFF